MSDANDTNKAEAREAGDTGENLHGGTEGHRSDIPEESPSTESGVALSQQVADREPEQQDDA